MRGRLLVANIDHPDAFVDAPIVNRHHVPATQSKDVGDIFRF
jgi:hypothetical protein